MTVNAPPPAHSSDRPHPARYPGHPLLGVVLFGPERDLQDADRSTIRSIEVVWARYVVAFGFMLVLFLPRSGLKLFRWRNVDTQIIRGLLLFFSSFLYFHGLVHMPLATAASISLCSPLIVTALSARLLGEPVGTKPLDRRRGGLRRRADRGAAGLRRLQLVCRC